MASLDHRRHVLLHIYQPSLRSPWWAARSGLEARSAALTRALPVTVESNRTNDLAGKYRTDDIVELLTAVGTEMSINQVIVELHNAGRPHENYDNVSADLAYLVERGRAARVRRGVYAAIRDPEADADNRIVITLTQGNLNNSHIYLTRHLDFFPADAIGGANRQAGQGRLLTLRFEGSRTWQRLTSLLTRRSSGCGTGFGGNSLNGTVSEPATKSLSNSDLSTSTA